MTRLKPLVIAAVVAAAVVSFIRIRLGDGPPADAGGWKPVDPA